MPLPIWPATVPHAPQRPSYRVSEPYNPPVTTEMEAGNDRDRPRGTLQHRVIDMDIRMTQAEFAAFDAFVGGDLAQGTRRFRMPVWLGDAVTEKTVKLTGQAKYTTRQAGRAVMVSLSLKVEL